MRERKPAHEVTSRTLYRADGLDDEDCIRYYMMAAADEDAAGVLDAMNIVARARLINELAASTGIDRRRLCGAFDGGPVLDDAEIAKCLECFDVHVSPEMPVAVG
jgi:DNA-binding phage protein